MTPERLRRASQLCAAALEHQPDERQSFVAHECGNDGELCTETLALLAAKTAPATPSTPKPAKPATETPKQIGRYRVDSVLGAGGMGIVYLAEDTTLGRQVAVKSLRLDREDVENFLRDRLFREARAVAALSHPGIVAVHDIFEADGQAHIVMEYAGATTLERAIAKTAPTRERTIEVIQQTAEALDYAHRHGIIHRDIKPSNLILANDTSIKIADFGIAKVSSAATQTATGVVLGTAHYMAPEQFKAQKIDGRADQFSLAVIAYKMLTRKMIFPDADSLPSLSYKICHEDPAPPSTIDAMIPQAVDGVLRRALAKDPNDRYPTCTAFAEALKTALTQPAVVVPAKKPKSRAVQVAAGIGLLAVAGGLAWYVMTRLSQPVDTTSKVVIQQPPPKVETPPPPPPVVTETPKKTEAVVTTVPKKHIETGGAGGVKGPDVKGTEKDTHTVVPPPPPSPSSGQMVWTGALDPGAELAIGTESAVSGTRLPGKPVRLEFSPAVVEVTSPPSAANGWKSFTIKNTSPRKQTLLIIKWTLQ